MNTSSARGCVEVGRRQARTGRDPAIPQRIVVVGLRPVCPAARFLRIGKPVQVIVGVAFASTAISRAS